MKKFICLLAVIGLLFIAACEKDDEAKADKKDNFLHLEDLDKEKVKKNVIESAKESAVLRPAEKDYKDEDFVNIEACEAIPSNDFDAKFEGTFIVHWETSDQYYEHYALMRDYKVENGSNYENVSDDRCLKIN